MRNQIIDNIDTATKALVDVNERVLDTVVDTNRQVVDRIVDAAAKLPTNPVADRLPTPAAAGSRYIDFVERAVAVNRDFTARIVAALPTGVAATAKTTATKASKVSKVSKK